MRILFLTWLLLLSTPLWAQTPKQYITSGDKELNEGYPQSAIFFYEKALALDTTIAEGHFKIGESYRYLRNYKRASAYYLAATDFDAKDDFPEAHFWLAMMLKQQGKYRDAGKRFDYFLDIYRLRDDLYRWARDEVESCEWAAEHVDDEPKYEVSKPDSGLNTFHAELSPMLVDSNTVYFSTMRYESDRVRKSNPVFIEVKKAVKDSSIWKLVDVDIPASEPGFHIANPTLSADSSTIYFSRCATLGDCKIYRSRRIGEDWAAAEEAPEPVNTSGSSSTQPMVVSLEDDEYLFFASDRERGKGGMDIWFVQIKKGEPVRRVRNLGSRVNSKGDEITPWFDANDSTFYFASNRKAGFGGFDIFTSQGAPGSFSLVENAGTEVNSPADDYYPSVRSQDSIGYFASNRSSGLKKEGNETCCNDFYKLRLKPEPVVIDTVVEDSVEIVEVDTIIPEPIPQTIEELQEYLPITLYFHNDRPNPRSLDTTTNRSYSTTLIDYSARLGEYLEEIDKSGLSDYDKQLNKQKTEDFFANTIGQSEENLARATDVLWKELQKGAQIELAVKGYASPLAQSDYNLNLTLRRIESMINFFKKYEDGVLLSYLNGTAENGGSLAIQKIPYGESQASGEATSLGTDRYNAIYSLTAARERRIEILRIERTEAQE